MAKFSTLPVKDIHVDPTVQRALNMFRVTNMAEDFNEDALGTVTVSRREDGKYYVIDGQHRHATARRAKGEHYRMNCHIYEGLSLQDEAALFRALNTAVKPVKIDLFRIRVVEGEAIAVAISTLMDHYGWHVAVSSGSRYRYTAVGALEEIFTRDGGHNLLDKTISVLTSAFDGDPKSVRSEMLLGLAALYAEHGERIKDVKMIERLQNQGLMDMLDRAKVFSKTAGYRPRDGVAEIITQAYNHRNTRLRLPQWIGLIQLREQG